MHQEITPAFLQTTQPLNRQIIQIDDPYMHLTVYWIFLRTGDSGILQSKRNRHSFYELQMMLNGQICQEVEWDGQKAAYWVAENQFMIVPPNHDHQVIASSTSGTRFSVAFDFDSPDAYIHSVLEKLMEMAVYPTGDLANTLVSLMLKVSTDPSRWAGKEISNLLQCLFFQLFAAIQPQDAPDDNSTMKPKRSMVILQQTQGYIADHIGNGITVEDVAKTLNISSRQLNRICNQHTGKSLNHLIRAEKLKYVKELIGTTTLSFSEIASMTGFSSEYALNRFFKYTEGYTLGQYRHLATL